MAFNAKYRPKNFDMIEWQSQVKDILQAEVQQWKLSSSYIFFWPRWTWKTSIARILSKAINCTDGKMKPCNECENCKLINQGKTLDFVEIDAASNTQVDKIREEIIDKSVYPPTTLKKKVYIIDEAHMLSKSAFNALLKIMEEPADYLTFILATTEINKVPETIISRCKVFNFKRIAKNEIIERLEFIAKEENLKYDKEGLALIAKISDGGMRDAIKFLEQVSIIWEVNAENATKFLWIVPERQIVEFLEIIQWTNINKIFESIDKLQENWVDLGNFVKDILAYLDEKLLENMQENLKLIKLFDEIYKNIKNFPSATLAYKTTIGDFFTDGLKIDKQEKIETTKKVKIEKVDKVEEKKVEKSKEFTKEELLAKLSSAQLKWAIKNFADLEREENQLTIIMISKIDYNILQKADKQKELDETIQTISPWCKFEIKFMDKQEYLNNKIQK